jgi:hypothetical protein
MGKTLGGFKYSKKQNKKEEGGGKIKLPCCCRETPQEVSGNILSLPACANPSLGAKPYQSMRLHRKHLTFR